MSEEKNITLNNEQLNTVSGGAYAWKCPKCGVLSIYSDKLYRCSCGEPGPDVYVPITFPSDLPTDLFKK